MKMSFIFVCKLNCYLKEFLRDIRFREEKMPPKNKVPEPERKPLIGRVGTNLRVGIVGVPNVGKSTFFNVLTKSSAAAENFPFCTIDPNENKLDEIDFNGLEDYKSDPLVICYKKFISRISSDPTGLNDVDPAKEQAKAKFDLDDWYPYCNSYYPHSERVDAFARTDHLLSSKVPPSVSSKSNSSIEQPNQRKFFYSTRDCQIEYLQSKPLSFLILGKPSIGEEELGKQLAEYWHCVYIDPETLIREEIESETRAGQCIEFNLRCGRAIGIDVILRLVEKRIKTESVAHRGFVMCGLPVIANDLYEEDPVSAESAVFTVHEIFEELLESAYDILMPPPAIPAPSRVRSSEEISLSVKTSKLEWDEEQQEQKEVDVVEINIIHQPSATVVPDDVVPLDLGDSKKSVCEPPQIGTNYEEQLNFIMDLINGPLMIIYMVCENQDVVNKRNDYRYDIYSETLIDIQREKAEKNLLSFFTQKHRLGLGVTNTPVELFEDIPRLLKDSSELIHLVRLPRDFPAHVQVQLEHFNDIAAKLLEAKILEHDPEHFLKVDGRTSISRMFTSVKWKLRVFNAQRVLIPEKILEANAIDIEGEGDNFTQQKKANYEDLDECFKIFSKKKIVNPMYKWLLGDWGTLCPVAMTEGSYINGDPNYAVNFMNTIFFCPVRMLSSNSKGIRDLSCYLLILDLTEKYSSLVPDVPGKPPYQIA
ncbi:hypothetical protein WA026_006966 [Henosepilachna vigintioctopunctata]|uniref:G domain-containing protein n=1 Tax=Henosepilachna vigintioctopunctata TaxID=420089 RepID=A0AAW1VB93_9CUCU